MRKHLERLHRKPAPPVAGSWHRAVTQVVGWGAYVSGMSFNSVTMVSSPLQTAKLLSMHSTINAVFPSFIHSLFPLSKYLLYTPKKTFFFFLILSALMNIAVII